MLQGRKNSEHFLDRPGPEAGLLGGDGQIAGHGQGGKDAPVVRHPVNAGAADRVGMRLCDALAVKRDLAALCRREAEDGARCRCFTGAIGAQQADHFAGTDVERDAEQRLGFAVKGLDIVNSKHYAPHHPARAPRFEARTDSLSRRVSGVPWAMT